MDKASKGRVLIGLSGGVDSAVSAYLLLKQGYQVEAAFMKNWSSTAGLKLSECPWLADRQEALRVAAFLGIPLHTLDFEKQYSKRVMDYFFKEYKAGRTPNPDVMCNKEIKFKLLYDWAMENGFDYLATGHYAQISLTSPSFSLNKERKKTALRSSIPALLLSKEKLDEVRYQLQRSKDEFKDQTYFIYNIRTEQLPHLLFPIGGMKKVEVKTLAKKIGLPNANRKESMGLCFVGKIRLKDFLEQRMKPKPGKIVLLPSSVIPDSTRQSSAAGNLESTKQKYWIPDSSRRLVASGMTKRVIGTHQGLHTYTIGQRQGIHVGGSGGPYYVVKKDLKANTLYVTNDPNDPLLEVSEVVVHSVNWIVELGKREKRRGRSKNADERMGSNLSPVTSNLVCRYRHQGDLVPCTIEKTGKDTYLVKFETPQKAIASGQSVVFYIGKVCLGGGVIA